MLRQRSSSCYKSVISLLPVETRRINKMLILCQSYPKSIIEKLSKSLKKGGILRICVPDGNSIHEKLKVMDWASPKGHKNSLNVVAPLEHINCFTTNSLIDLAINSGLQWHYLNYYPALELIENKASLLNEIKIATMLPIKIIKYFGRIVKIKLGMRRTL